MHVKWVDKETKEGSYEKTCIQVTDDQYVNTNFRYYEVQNVHWQSILLKSFLNIYWKFFPLKVDGIPIRWKWMRAIH